MLTTCLLLAALAPAESVEMIDRPPSLRELCIEAPVVVLARPVDPANPMRLTVLDVLRGRDVKVGQRVNLTGLVEAQIQSFDTPDPQTRKPRPRHIDQVLLFLTHSKAAMKDAWAVLPAGFRLCSEDGRVLVPASVAPGQNNKMGPPQVADKVTWTALVGRVRADLAAVEQLQAARKLGRPVERTRRLLDWLQKRRTEFGSTPSLPTNDLAPAGWGKLGFQVFDWIFESENHADCWSAVKLYASLNRGEAPRLSYPVYSSPAGRTFLMAIASDTKQLPGDRRRAIELFAQPITLWPSSGGARDTLPLSAKEQEDFLEQLRLLLTARDEDIKTAVVAAMLQVSRPGKDQPPKPSEILVNTLAEMYRPALPGAYRDELARALCQLAPERYGKLSGNPAGVCACLDALVYKDGELLFFLDLRTGSGKVFEQPTLVLERPGALGFVAETKRVPLPVLNLEGGWAKGVGGEAVLAVNINLAKVITIPQPNPRAPGKSVSTLWRVRVEGSVGKGAAKQVWKSETQRIAVRPAQTGMEGPGYPRLSKW
jgi:hypothetical protein